MGMTSAIFLHPNLGELPPHTGETIIIFAEIGRISNSQEHNLCDYQCLSVWDTRLSGMRTGYRDTMTYCLFVVHVDMIHLVKLVHQLQHEVILKLDSSS